MSIVSLPSVNGATHEVDIDASTPLLYVLRNDLGLRGPRFGCGLALHRQPAYEAAAKGVSLPVAEALARTALSLPIHPLLDEASIDRIAACVRESLR